MTAGQVTIPDQILSDIRTHLGAMYPNEGCGLLLGSGLHASHAVVEASLPVHNERVGETAARTRFLITPTDFLHAEATARKSGLELLGTYHSHPDVPPLPSSYDREHAWPAFRYLIISVNRGVPGQQRVWRLADDRSDFVEHELLIKEPQVWP
jgi:proteasome lid subunit RPN8/RPN11